jgi:endonuclease/exonuclease/phosphatase family metal-dependent hydrolase
VDEVSSKIVIPPKGSSSTLDIGGWNLEWFGSSSYGPTNETLQRQNIRDTISGADLDIWAVQEIVGASSFNTLKSELPGYAGFLANDPIVTSGSSYYGSSEQKVGILYKSSVMTVQSAKLILTADDYNFAGRPPLEVSLQATVGAATTDLVMIILHAKAMSDSDSYNRRKAASTSLKSYLDSTHANHKVIVVGDFNDDVDTSIAVVSPNGGENLTADSTEPITWTSANVANVNIDYTVNGTSWITVATGLAASAGAYSWTVPNQTTSSALVRISDATNGSVNDTSNSAFTITGSGVAVVVINEIGANEPGSSVTGEFVELYNVGGAAADLSGWTLSDSSSVRHTFPAGTTLGPGSALVVFGGASAIPPGVSNAVAASTGTLSLNNSSDTVKLKNSSSAVIDSFSYPSSLASTDGVSMNRNPDASATGSFVLHTSLASAPSSPGTRANGASF